MKLSRRHIHKRMRKNTRPPLYERLQQAERDRKISKAITPFQPRKPKEATETGFVKRLFKRKSD